MILFYILLIVIGVLGFFAVGINVSEEIDNSTVYMLFWMLYTITFFTLVNIILTFFYYQIVKGKKGVKGERGPIGDMGEPGEAGSCEASCRDNICVNSIKESMSSKLKKLSGKDIPIENIYLITKIKQMCGSPEFKEVAPYNGPTSLISYLSDVWNEWVELIYNSGGLKYFRTLGAETEWEWVKENPFDEMKKYDVFYWGMGKEYRPKNINSCARDIVSNRDLIKVCNTNNFIYLANSDGTGSTQSASFWRPKMVTFKGVNYYPVGDIVVGPTTTNDNIKTTRYVGEITINTSVKGPNIETILVAGDTRGPLSYELIWDSGDIGSNENIFVWRPIGPKTKNGNYIALGDVITTDPSPPPTGVGAPIRCVKQNMLYKVNHNGNVLWSSSGSSSTRYTNLLGFNKNNGNGNLVDSRPSNAYNLFRGVKGNITIIPDSDENAQFYAIQSEKINPNGIPGKTDVELSIPQGEDAELGYQPTPRKDSKYSIQSFLELKTEGYIYNRNSQKTFSVRNASNDRANSYLVIVGEDVKNNLEDNYCLSAPKTTLSTSKCLSTYTPQYFRIELTGNERNQCRLRHGNSGKFLIVSNGSLELVDTIPKKDTSSDPSIFYFK